MKNLLSVEQSATLIAKGISADKASMCQLYSDYDGEIIDPSEVFEDCGKLLAVVNDEAIDVSRNIVFKDSDFDHSFADDMPIFTLADILSLLPKHIGDFGNLMMDFNNLYGKWDVCYELSEYMQSETELIDALFSTLCWAIEKNFLTK